MVTIVVVDEDRTFVNQLQAILTEAGHTVFGIVGRDEAVRTFEQLGERVDLAIIDFLVPGTTGPELIGMVKRRLPRVKVIATIPAEGTDLTRLAEGTDADLVIRRSPKSEPPNLPRWVRAVDTLLRGQSQPGGALGAT